MAGRDVFLYIFEGMADWEASYAIAGINNPRFQQEPGRYRVTTLGVSLEPVTTMGGLRIVPERSLAEVDPDEAAMLILPGGEAWETGGNRAAVELARVFFVQGVPIAAICAATRALACAGMLDDFHHTSNSREYLAETRYRGRKFYCDVPAIADEGVITASGTAPLEFAREIFRLLDLYSEPTLDAWYAMFKFGEAGRFAQLAQYAAG